MNRLTAVRVWLALFLAAYNVVMFGIDLAYDSGATYQWATYPLACFAWAFCVAIMMLEIKYGMSISWVLRAFFLASFVAACLLLGADIAARAASSTHILHFLLLALMAGVGSMRPESDSGDDDYGGDSADYANRNTMNMIDADDPGYAPTPLDLAHISFDDEEDLQLLQEGATPVSQDLDDAIDREAGAATTFQPLSHPCHARLRHQEHRRQQRPERAPSHDVVQ